MVLGYHLIITAYGFWLPNDPRGSWSDFVGAWELVRFGKATKTDERHSVAAKPHDYSQRMAAKNALKYPPVHFNEKQISTIAKSFGEFLAKSGVTFWACSILSDHVHMVVARHQYKAEQIANLLKGSATTTLKNEKIHPFAGYPEKNGRLPKMWAQDEWKVFLDSDGDIRRAIRYVENNPVKEGMPLQNWPFIVKYNGIMQ
jgi:REP element-mobilizing transposase RayT